MILDEIVWKLGPIEIPPSCMGRVENESGEESAFEEIKDSYYTPVIFCILYAIFIYMSFDMVYSIRFFSFFLESLT